MTTIAIHGARGNHAQDIIKRGIFDGYNLIHIDVENKIEEALWADIHMVFFPIQDTRRRIGEILKLCPNTPIINFSGIQCTTPWENITDESVLNAHFLFWPNMKSDLKVSVSNLQKLRGLAPTMVNNIESKWIRIVEHSQREHDQKVWITQWLAHALFLAMSEAQILPGVLFKRWKDVPANTSWGMIHYNQFAMEKIQEFLKLLETFSIPVALQILKTQNAVDDFVTPNFDRIYKAIMSENGPESNMSLELLEMKKDTIIFHMKQILRLDQKWLVEIIEQTRNGW